MRVCAVNGDICLACVRQQRVPGLCRGNVVVMDHLPCHKKVGVREALKSVDARLGYLPPYSPDVYPIEQAFSKLKTRLRKFDRRTVEALGSRIGQLVDKFTPYECCNDFRHCGYH